MAYLILHNFSNALSSSECPTSLKYADIKPIFKRDHKTDKTNYRPTSILPNVRKIYERFMQNQIYTYLYQVFSKYQCGFRKGFNTQPYLMAMIGKWRKSLKAGSHAGAPLIYLSKAFDCIDHELLMVKLHAYGFDTDALKFIYPHLRERKKRTNINYSYSSFVVILFGVPQGTSFSGHYYLTFTHVIFFTILMI